ncbi:hypothetical protein EYF80_041766 [Liparis tanakae]|uniref:Uncharacterized protein n=1 Tax=Liparis tanakae TaxID=230148 RepID=A0A4Z2G3B6_9TELE|nr:hypothetical protein EYF80_041766 [Liparis tanakae]
MKKHRGKRKMTVEKRKKKAYELNGSGAVPAGLVHHHHHVGQRVDPHLLQLQVLLKELQRQRVGTQGLSSHPLNSGLCQIQPVRELLQLLVLQLHQDLVESGECSHREFRRFICSLTSESSSSLRFPSPSRAAPARRTRPTLPWWVVSSTMYPWTTTIAPYLLQCSLVALQAGGAWRERTEAPLELLLAGSEELETGKG